MQITSNRTPFLAELFVFTDKDGCKHCIVVVKATFNVGADGKCLPACEQTPFVYVDQHYGDPGTTAIRYETDFMQPKLYADILLNADAVATNGRPVTTLEVGLLGPGFSKRAVVTGDRIWEQGWLGIQASAPLPFVSMPLVWHHAFGGSDQSHKSISKNGAELRNLVGTGFHLNSKSESIVGKRLPNIEQPDG